MVSLKEQRERQIKELVQWLKLEYPKILERLRQKKYRHYNTEQDEYELLTFDELFKVDKIKCWALMGAEVFKTLRSHIAETSTWSAKTQLDYARTVMYAVGCKFTTDKYERLPHWFCRLKLKLKT